MSAAISRCFNVLSRLVHSLSWELVVRAAGGQDTNGNFLLALTRLLTDTLNTGDVDYLTPENTAVTDVSNLKPLALPSGTGRRRLLSDSGAADAAVTRRGFPKIVGGSRGEAPVLSIVRGRDCRPLLLAIGGS